MKFKNAVLEALDINYNHMTLNELADYLVKSRIFDNETSIVYFIIERINKSIDEDYDIKVAFANKGLDKLTDMFDTEEV